jgi:hypothetical protein
MKVLITVDTCWDACQPEYTFLDRLDLEGNDLENYSGCIINVPKNKIKKWEKIQFDFWKFQNELKEIMEKYKTK